MAEKLRRYEAQTTINKVIYAIPTIRSRKNCDVFKEVFGE